MHARHEVAVAAQHLEHGLAHAGHDLHAHRDVGAVGELDADVGDVRAERTHRERHDVHRPPAHAAAKERRRAIGQAGLKERPHLGRRLPVVGGAGVFLTLGANESAVLDPGDVARAAARQEAARTQHRVERHEGAGGAETRGQAVVFGGAAVAPVDVLGFGQRSHRLDPVDQLGVVHVRRRTPTWRGEAVHRRCSHDGSREVVRWQRSDSMSGAGARPVSGSVAGPVVVRSTSGRGSRLVGGVSAGAGGARILRCPAV